MPILPAQGTGTISDLVAGLDWVASNAKPPAVATLSLGVPVGQVRPCCPLPGSSRKRKLHWHACMATGAAQTQEQQTFSHASLAKRCPCLRGCAALARRDLRMQRRKACKYGGMLSWPLMWQWSQSLEQAARNLITKYNITVIVASGNSEEDSCYIAPGVHATFPIMLS